MRVFAGPNGSGKTTLVRQLSKEYSPRGLFRLHRFINADDLLTELTSPEGLHWPSLNTRLTWPTMRAAIIAGKRVPATHPFLLRAKLHDDHLSGPVSPDDAYLAAAIADALREDALNAGTSFAFETVMSHESKIAFMELARAMGYRVYLYFVATDLVELNHSRIQTRVGIGGHDVPPDKIEQRYHRSLRLLRRAMAASDRAYLFDNTGRAPMWIAERAPDGALSQKVGDEFLPAWFTHYAG